MNKKKYALILSASGLLPAFFQPLAQAADVLRLNTALPRYVGVMTPGFAQNLIYNVVVPTGSFDGNANHYLKYVDAISVNIPFFRMQVLGSKSIYEAFRARFENTAFSLQVERMSDDGKGFQGTVAIENARFSGSPAFRPLFANGESLAQASVGFRVESCDGEAVETAVTTPDSLEDVIKSFRAVKAIDYLSCKVTGVNPSHANPVAYQGIEGAFSLDQVLPYGDTFIVQRNGDIVFNDQGGASGETYLGFESVAWNEKAQMNVAESPAMSTPPVSFRLRQQGTPSEEKAKEAAEAVSELVDIMYRYGDGLILLSERSEAARRHFTAGFIQKNGPGIKEQIKQIQERVPYLGIVNLISVNTSISRAYNYVHYLEGKISGEFSLDSVVKSYE